MEDVDLAKVQVGTDRTLYVQAFTHQHLLRSLDALMNHQEAVDDVVANLLRPLVDQDQDLSLVHGRQPPV